MKLRGIIEMNSKTQKPLTVFKLAMMAVIVIDSLKNLPSNAQYGSNLLFYYTLAILIFFIPSALVSAEMATSFPKAGGSYVWIREAFGKTWSFVAIWSQWLVTMTWAPTILTFIVLTTVYWVAPTQIENNRLLLFFILSVFWASVGLISCGMKLSSYISTFSAIIGVVLPMGFISCLGVYWLTQFGYTNSTALFTLPKMSLNADHLRLLLPLLFSLMGIEAIAVHANDVHNPQKSYPKALLLAGFLIFCTVIPASLSIITVIPVEEIELTTGVIEGFGKFLNAFHMSALLPVIVCMIVIGGFGIFYTWLLTVSRYLLAATKDGSLPKIFQKTNKNGMPMNLLIFEGIVFSSVCSLFLLMPSIEQAFWLLTAACAQFGLLFYIFVFSAAIKLRFKYPDLHRPFQVGKSNFLIVLMSSAAILMCAAAIAFGFIPPSSMPIQSKFLYEICLASVIVFGFGLGFLIFGYSYFVQKKSNQTITNINTDSV